MSEKSNVAFPIKGHCMLGQSEKTLSALTVRIVDDSETGPMSQ